MFTESGGFSLATVGIATVCVVSLNGSAESSPVRFELNSKTVDVRVAAVKSASQDYFWTHFWQAGERAADEDIRLGRVHSFESVEDALAALDADEDEEV